MLPLILGQLASTVGKAGAGFADAASLYTESDADRLRKLQRLQELGQLGLSDEELAVMREQSFGPLQAALRQQDLQAAARTQLQDIGSGQEALRQMAEDDRVARQMNVAGAALAREQGVARKAQEAELRALQKARDQQGAAYAKAALGALAGVGDAGVGLAQDQYREQALKELEVALAQARAGGDTGESAEAIEDFRSTMDFL